MAAAFFRVPTGTSGLTAPVNVGYAPYESQQLNTGTQLGRTVLIHNPDDKPLKPGPYQVVLGAASATKYSITVEAHAVQTAPATLHSEATRAKKIQEELRLCRVATDDLWTSMRLGERKVLVVQALMDEAEVESSRCEQETERCNTELAIDDERMELTDDQRRALYANVRTLEVEFAHWCRLFASRSQERVDLLAGLRILRNERRDRLADTERLGKEIAWLQRHLPAAYGMVKGMEEATRCALDLNTTFENIKTGAAKAQSQWKKVATLKGLVTSMMTPAEEVRRRHKTEGWNALMLPEQQWSVLDRIRFPDKCPFPAASLFFSDPRSVRRVPRARV
jgi:hypothetical protein